MADLDFAELRILSDAQFSEDEGARLDIAEMRLLGDDPNYSGAVVDFADVRILSGVQPETLEFFIEVAELRVLGAAIVGKYLDVAEVRLVAGDVVPPVPTPEVGEPATLRLEAGYWKMVKRLRVDENGDWYGIFDPPTSGSPVN
jgi:hypothetical protein